MKIIDFAKKGNVVRFFLGADDLEEWYGDDWDDTPYEYNAGEVYERFVSAQRDIAFPFDDLVLEPQDCGYKTYSGFCKNDMIVRRVPCIIVVPKELADTSWDTSFAYWAGADGVKRYYFGDRMETDEE